MKAIMRKMQIFKILIAGTFVLSSVSTSLVQARNNEWVVTDADYPPRNEYKENLGKLLFYDKILSGNKNTSCATCHHPLAWTGDGLSLSVGEGGRGLGIMRDTGTKGNEIKERVPRNAPHVFNLGAYEFTTMFHDGRVQQNDKSPTGTGFDTPAGDDFLVNIDNALSAQAAFPPTSTTEMAGQKGENEVADAAAAGNIMLVWSLLTDRIKKIPAYYKPFKLAYPDLNDPNDVTFAHIANAIGAFEAAAYRSDNSPFDRFMRGDEKAVSDNALSGGVLFYGKAQCASCHAGKFQTDHQFHAIGIPQIGPGKGDGYKNHDDFGREQVTGDDNDRYKFRTPTLRNVALTGPWGHDGAYSTLDAMLRHHLNPESSLNNYDITQAILPSRKDLDALDFMVYNDVSSRSGLIAAIELEPIKLKERQIIQIMDFLNALTDPNSLNLYSTAPTSVPSGLPLAD